MSGVPYADATTMSRLRARYVFGAAVAALGIFLIALIAAPRVAPKPEPSESAAALPQKTIRVIPITRPPAPPARVALAEAEPMQEPPPPMASPPATAAPAEPKGDPPLDRSRRRERASHDICARHGGHQVEFQNGRRWSWRCVYARRR